MCIENPMLESFCQVWGTSVGPCLIDLSFNVYQPLVGYLEAKPIEM